MPTPIDAAVVLHPVCSVTTMGLEGKLRAIDAACAREAIVSLAAGCCGFAGDRGLLVPELTPSALSDEAPEVRALDASSWYSSSRACEIGLTRATGIRSGHDNPQAGLSAMPMGCWRQYSNPRDNVHFNGGVSAHTG